MLAFSLIENGLSMSLACALLGLVYAIYLVRWILKCPAGNERMKEIGAAIQLGAAAYLNRQMVSIGAIAAILFALVWAGRGMESALGFFLGAACSLAAGFIGMNLAVRANVRTTQAATVSESPRCVSPSMAEPSPACSSSAWPCSRSA